MRIHEKDGDPIHRRLTFFFIQDCMAKKLKKIQETDGEIYRGFSRSFSVSFIAKLIISQNLSRTKMKI